MLTSLLVYRLIIFNIVGAVLLAFAWQRGLVSIVLDGDSTGIVYLIAGVFVVGMASLFIRAFKVSRMLDGIKRNHARPNVNRVKFLEKMAHLDDVTNWLVTLGLLGTVIGVSIAMFGLDQASLQSAEGTKRVVTNLIGGMQVALYTTIVGGILGMWMDVNRRMLKTAAILMLEDLRSSVSGRTSP